MYNLRWGIVLISIILCTNIFFIVIKGNYKAKFSRSTPFLLYLAFLVYSVITSLINNISIENIIISSKNYFQFFALILYFTIYPHDYTFINRIKISLMRIALVQPIVAIFQYLLIVPKLRGITGSQSTSVLDAVSGTFGTSLEGGGTGVLALFICSVLCATLLSYNRKEISFYKFLILSLYLLIPLLISETKVALFFLAIGSTFIVVFDTKTNFKKKVTTIIFALALIISCLFSFVILSSQSGKSGKDVLEETIAYNFGDKGHAQYRLNRTTCLSFWFQENKSNIVDTLIGHGLDATEERGVGLNSIGHIALKYYMYGTGRTSVSSLLWEVGIIGVILFIGVLLICLINSLLLSKSNKISNNHSYICITLACSTLLIITNLFYNSAYRSSQPANFLITLVICLVIAVSKEKYLTPNRG